MTSRISEVYVIVRQLLQEYHCDGQELLGAEQARGASRDQQDS